MDKKKLSVLCIDDEEMIRFTVGDYLEDSGYTVLMAENGKTGLEIFREKKPDVVLVDLMMPEVNGFEVVSAVKQESPQTPIIVISGTGIIQDVIEANRRGAWDYLTKPIQSLAVLQHVVEKSLEKAALIRENEAYKKSLEEKVRKRTLALEKINTQLREILWETVNALSVMTDKRDPYTSGHQKRVSVLALDIAAEMGFSEDRMEAIKVASLLHDIGKIYVPAEFLSKPTRLEPEEMQVIRKHSFMGYDILINIAFPWPIAEIVYQHHERIDGSGYPRGIKGDDILLEAKIIAIADVVEAMSSHRPYRPSLDISKAISEIESGKGKIYCPACADAFLEIICKDINRIKTLLKTS
ncbi:MAG: hypothetical protein BWK80_02780 [Desulfobacteraceae bacterium IS3]|nr:MAG: hypothetical protein BWK80_02780 [Desulfobacteraceae bacterium IS3]